MKTKTNGRLRQRGFVHIIILGVLIHAAFIGAIIIGENPGGGVQPDGGPWPNLPTMP